MVPEPLFYAASMRVRIRASWREWLLPMINDNLIRSLGDQLGRFINDSAAREDMQKSLNTIVQSAFARLDLVTREQFDAQLETLQRTRTQLERLEAEIARLQEQLAQQEQPAPD
jgi:ubiquinone biosynthesis accessory factor UbiK